MGAEPVYRSNRAELTALMGEEGYAELVLRCEAHLDTVKRARSAGARQLIPLLVHPATVAAGTVGGRRTRVPRKRTTRTACPGPTSRPTRCRRPRAPGRPRPPRRQATSTKAVERQGRQAAKAPAKPAKAPAKPAKAPAKPAPRRPPRRRSRAARRDPQPEHLGHPGRLRAGEPRLRPGRGHRHHHRRPAPPRAAPTSLDIGCGTGFHLPRLAARGARVVGVEPHLPARRPRTGHGSPRCRAHPASVLVAGDAEALPLADAQRRRRARALGLLLRRRVRAGAGRGRAGAAARAASPCVVDNDVTRSTFGAWFRRSYPAYDPVAVQRFWDRQGFTTEHLTIAWTFDRRDDLEAVARIELPPGPADEVLAAHDGPHRRLRGGPAVEALLSRTEVPGRSRPATRGAAQPAAAASLSHVASTTASAKTPTSSGSPGRSATASARQSLGRRTDPTAAPAASSWTS